MQVFLNLQFHRKVLAPLGNKLLTKILLQVLMHSYHLFDEIQNSNYGMCKCIDTLIGQYLLTLPFADITACKFFLYFFFSFQPHFLAFSTSEMHAD